MTALTVRSKPSHYVHGMTKTRFHKIWIGMKFRAGRERGYEHIKVSSSWCSFLNFRDDMLSSYNQHVKKHGESRTSIDRINSHGNYCKENCRWATPGVQNNNQRDSDYFHHNGQTKTLMEWSRVYKMNWGTLWSRIHRDGWTFEEAVELKQRSKITHKLTTEQVKQIRKLKKKSPKMTNVAISLLFDISSGTVGRIIERKTWR